MADYGVVEEVKPDGVVAWRRANPTPGGCWTGGYEVGEAESLPVGDPWLLKVGDVLPLYRHGGRVFYGPPITQRREDP